MKGTVSNNPRWSEWLDSYDDNPFPAVITIESLEVIDLIHIKQNIIEVRGLKHIKRMAV